MSELCSSCGAAIENSAVTGIFCADCHGAEVSTGGGTYLKGLVALGAAAGTAPFFFHVTVNGLNYVALGGGAIAILAGIVMVVKALRGDPAERNKPLGAGLGVLCLGGLQIFLSGIL